MTIFTVVSGLNAYETNIGSTTLRPYFDDWMTSTTEADYRPEIPRRQAVKDGILIARKNGIYYGRIFYEILVADLIDIESVKWSAEEIVMPDRHLSEEEWARNGVRSYCEGMNDYLKIEVNYLMGFIMRDTKKIARNDRNASLSIWSENPAMELQILEKINNLSVACDAMFKSIHDANMTQRIFPGFAQGEDGEEGSCNVILRLQKATALAELMRTNQIVFDPYDPQIEFGMYLMVMWLRLSKVPYIRALDVIQTLVGQMRLIL